METLQLRIQRNRGMVWMLKNGIAAIVVWLLVGFAGAAPVFAVDNLIDHDYIDKNNVNHGKDPVLTNPNLYITYWGSDWINGFSYLGVPSSQYQAYLENLLNGVGGGPWIGTQAQYRGSGSQPGVIKGTWIDPVDPAKLTPTTSDTEAELIRSILYFQGYYGLIAALNNTSPDPNNVYLIVFPPGYGPVGFIAKGGSGCAWHSAAYWIPYIVLPFMPDGGLACGIYAVNPFPPDQFGHGIFDSASLAAGHEWGETVTDPFTRGGWYGNSGLSAETGDKCAYQNMRNMKVGGSYYAMQPLWSNNDSKCVFGANSTTDQSPLSHDFGYVALNTTTNPQIVTLTNNGDLELKFASQSSNGPWGLRGANAYDFKLSGNTCGLVLNPGDSCQIEVRFRPASFGSPSNATLDTIIFNSTGDSSLYGPATTLTGEGVHAWFFADPSLIVSDDAFIQSTRPTAPPPELPVRVFNEGVDPRYIQKVEIGGPHPADFSIFEDGCSIGGILEPSQSCMISLRFHPTATGDRQAELEVTTADVTGAPGETFSIPVMGKGLGPVAQLSSTNLSFGEITYNRSDVVVGGEIPVSGEVLQNVIFNNTGQSPLEVNGVEVTGDFALFNNGCTQSLQPGEFCTIQVRIMPTHFQFQSGSLMIYDNSSDSPHEVKLAGVVSAPLASLSRDDMQLGFAPVGITSSPQTVQLENLEGDMALHIQSIEATGDFTATSDCPQDLLIGKCTITITMKPTSAGLREGMLVVTHNAPNSPQQIPLIGTGCGRGDLDCDGDVDRNDLRILLSHINKPVSSCPGCDLNGDGKINVFDAIRLVTMCTRLACAVR